MHLATATAPQAAALYALLCVLAPDGAALPLRRVPAPLLQGGPVDSADTPLDEDGLARLLAELAADGRIALEPEDGGSGYGVRIPPDEAAAARSALDGTAAATGEQAARILEAARGLDPDFEAAGYRALRELREHALGPVHPDTLATALHCARLAQVGAPSERTRECARIRTIAERELGADHPVTLAARRTAAEARSEAGDPALAHEECAKVAAACDRRWGPGHPETLSALLHAGVAAGHRGYTAAAAELLDTVAERAEAQGGAEDPVALEAVRERAFLALAAGDAAGALQRFDRVAAASARTLGPEHPDTLDARFHQALAWARTGERDRACAALSEVAGVRTARLGADHPATARTRAALTTLERSV
ncbi:hypothetical protein GCM10027440_06670 [Nocardiopsis coralliicola]